MREAKIHPAPIQKDGGGSVTDRRVKKFGGGRKKTGHRIAKGSFLILVLLALEGCKIGQETAQEQPQTERIGNVAHRDKAENKAQEVPEDTGSSSEEKIEDGQEDALHLGQIPMSGEEEQAELTFRIAGEVEDLPQKVQDQIARINKGEQLWKVIGSNDLKDYYALTGTHTVEAQDRDSGQEAVGAGRLTMYVPNLLEGLTDIAVLFYDNAAGKWCLIPAEKVDMEKRTVSMILTGSGTLTVIHRTQGETEE